MDTANLDLGSRKIICCLNDTQNATFLLSNFYCKIEKLNIYGKITKYFAGLNCFLFDHTYNAVIYNYLFKLIK